MKEGLDSYNSKLNKLDYYKMILKGRLKNYVHFSKEIN
jgi:hypothetical protein